MIEVELQEWMGSDAAIANAAWTSSYTKPVRDIKYEDAGAIVELIQRLATEGHSVPFESVVFRFWIQMPLFIDRQHMTHRIASHNGLSGRYRTLPNKPYPIPKDVTDILYRAGLLGTKIKLEGTLHHSNLQYNVAMNDLKCELKRGSISNAEYKRCREIVRGVLPQANMVERTTIMNLRSWANYLRLRLSPHAQPEIREVATKMLKAVRVAEVCPVALEALAEQRWVI